MRVQCPKCQHAFAVLPGERAQCANCGHLLQTDAGAGSRRTLAVQVSPTQPLRQPRDGPPPSPRRTPRSPESPRARAAGGLVLNLVLPGAGTILVGRKGEGQAQLLLLLLGILTIPWLVGLAVVAGVWVWGVAVGLAELARREASSKRTGTG